MFLPGDHVLHRYSLRAGTVSDFEEQRKHLPNLGAPGDLVVVEWKWIGQVKAVSITRVNHLIPLEKPEDAERLRAHIQDPMFLLPHLDFPPPGIPTPS